MVRWHPLVGALLVLWGLAGSGVQAACPGPCDCKRGDNGSVVYCRYQRLRTFPNAAEFPDDTVELDYGNNEVTDVSDLPKLPNLRKLLLDNCKIHTLGSRPFANLPSLRNLTLNNNKIEQLERTSFQGLPSLEGLYLANNQLRLLAVDVFAGLSLLQLNLGGNAIDSLDEFVFRGLSVQHLNLSDNNLDRLSRNMLRSLQTSLVSFHMDHNARELTIDRDTFVGFIALELLSVQSSHIQDLAFLEGVHSLRALDLSGNHFPALDLRPFSPSLASVETLGLANMGLQWFSASQILSGLSALRQLDLSNNGMVMMSGTWFQSTLSLSRLKLSGNKLFQLPPDLGRNLASIEALDVSGNALRSVRAESFSAMHLLRELDLRNNKIQVFSENLKPLFNALGPQLLLEGNPLHCNCEMVWYRAWLLSSRSHTAATRCVTPTPAYIYNLEPEEFTCRPPSIVDIEPAVHAFPAQDVLLQCVGEGDPAPVVEWTDPFGEAITMSPSENRTRHKTFNTWLLSTVNEDYSGNYTCRARNVDGEVWAITYLLVSPTAPPAPSTTLQQPTTASELSPAGGTTSSSPAENTAEVAPVDTPISSSKSTPATSTMGMHGSDAQATPSHRTLAIAGGVVGSLCLVLLLVVCVAVRARQSRRRYDVSRHALHSADSHPLDLSKDAKICEEEESRLVTVSASAV